jgi:integrase/recombinase XerD
LRQVDHRAVSAAGYREPGTTKLYDRRGYNPEKSASFFATY